MPDIDAQLERIERALNDQFSGVNGRLDTIDKRLEGVDKRLEGVDTRLEGVDKRLEGVDTRLNALTILGEANTTQIRLVAEVQSRHGELLQELLKDVEPLKVLKDVCETAVRDHEQRITAIEQGRK
jgi:archaellum component FlaC